MSVLGPQRPAALHLPISKAPALPLGLVVVVLALLGSRVWFAAFGMPILLGDAVFFIPTAMQHLLYGDLSNPHLSPIREGGGPYVWHGWLYPTALSVLGSLTSSTTTAAIQVIDAVLVALAGLIFALKVGRTEANGWLKAATVVCACGFMAITAGRPEVIVQLLLVIWLVAFRPPAPGRFDLLTAVVLGLIAVAQPTAAMLAAVFYATWLTYSQGTRNALLTLVPVAVVSLAITLGLTALFYPWSFAELAQGLLAQARSLSVRTDGDFIGNYFKSTQTPLLILWPALAVFAIGALVARFGKPKSVLFYPLLVLCAFFVWRFGMRISFTAYNVTVFYPLLAYALLLMAASRRLPGHFKVFRWALPALAALMLVAQVRGLALLLESWRQGVAGAEVVQSIEADLRQGRKVAVTLNLAMADYRLSRTPGLIVMPLSEEWFVGDANVLYLHQASSGNRTPPQWLGWTLVDDRFMQGVSLRGMRIANTPLSFNYARYERQQPAPKP